jgi:hypothetical protein
MLITIINITTARKLASCHKNGGAMQLPASDVILNEADRHVPSTRTREWLPEIAHFNNSVHANKNAIDPITSLQLW